MAGILANQTFRHLFAAHVVSLLGAGFITVALALLAYDLAGGNAGMVLGTALAIKMIAYVVVAPIASAFIARLPRRRVLVSMDVIRAGIVLALPFVDQIWQIYLLIFLLQSCSAVFTPTFQASIPDILPGEKDYTRALALSRIAYDLENLLSPLLAAALLTVMSFHWLFGGTALAFMISALLILSVRLPDPAPATDEPGIRNRITRGLRIYLNTPRLRGLLALNLAIAAAGAMVIVNTVVFVRDLLDRTDVDVAIAFAVFGAGSMLAALFLPRVLRHLDDRKVMLPASAWLAICLIVLAIWNLGERDQYDWTVLLMAWFVLGIGYSALLTPAGRLLRRSAQAPDRPAVYAAQFALSHACWLITYPLAGWLGAVAGMNSMLLILGALAAFSTLAAAKLWPAPDPGIIEHIHDNLPPDHTHLQDSDLAPGGRRHAHHFTIDAYHQKWPE